MKLHELKTDPLTFDEVWQGRKRFEIRLNDRDFKDGDVLRLRRTQNTGAEMANGAPLVYTGLALEATVLHVMHGPIYGLADGWVVMSISPIRHFTESDHPVHAAIAGMNG